MIGLEKTKSVYRLFTSASDGGKPTDSNYRKTKPINIYFKLQ
jgi:hypothetical protein